MKNKLVKLLDTGQRNETIAIVEINQNDKKERDKMSLKGRIDEDN